MLLVALSVTFVRPSLLCKLHSPSFGFLNANFFCCSDYIARLDGFTVIKGGWLNQHWSQIGFQLSNSFAGGFYSFIMTCIILGVLDFLGKWIPPLKLRATEEEEILGIDDVEIGEFAVCSFRTPWIIVHR
jgi:ammonia channel protein AmtB